LTVVPAAARSTRHALVFYLTAPCAIIKREKSPETQDAPEQISPLEEAMRHFPSVELLENTHQFPGYYMFKVIGKADNGFIARTVAAVREELFMEQDPPYFVREPRSGRHVAITLEPLVRDAEQVLALYRRLVELEGLVLLW
jgi:putative lipoic acid-binding regulatory protein